MKKFQLAALAALGAGMALAVTGVYLLAGAGWALIASSVPCFGLFVVIQRGLRAERSRNG